MALKDFLSLVDAKLKTNFEQKKPDPTKARGSVLKRLDKAAEQYAQTEPVRGRKMFTINNNVMALELPFAINGETTFYAPSERGGDLIKSLRAAVETGELDEAIAAGTEGSVTTDKPKRAGGKRGPLSDEALAARRAKVAARKNGQG
jgi:hypothetical protein